MSEQPAVQGEDRDPRQSVVASGRSGVVVLRRHNLSIDFSPGATVRSSCHRAIRVSASCGLVYSESRLTRLGLARFILGRGPFEDLGAGRG